MKNKRIYKNIEELYRAKLGKRQYPVPDNFWPRFAKKLRLREFMNFRPGSFNIYYLAGLIAVAAVTVSVLSTKSKEPFLESPNIIIDSDSLSVAPRNIIIEKDNKALPEKIKEEGTHGKDETTQKIIQQAGENEDEQSGRDQ